MVTAAQAQEVLLRLRSGYLGIDRATLLTNGCVLHQKTPNEQRYVKTKLRGGSRTEFYIHHLVVRASGELINRALEVSHLCHNKRCINPEHLIQETQEYNRSRQPCAIMKVYNFTCTCGEQQSIWPCPHDPQCIPQGKLVFIAHHCLVSGPSPAHGRKAAREGAWLRIAHLHSYY